MMTDTTGATQAKSGRRPASVSIKPMRLRFTFDERVPRAWFDHDPFLSHYLNALSMAFPDGERFFMESVRAVRDRVDDPLLLEEIRGFIGQEALHGDAHEKMNAHLRERGYPVDAIVGMVKWLLELGDDVAGRSGRLGITCGLEHVTALLGDMVLGDPEFTPLIDESIRSLWVWHAMEETEHKGVAFDVYESVYGESRHHYAERIGTLVLASAILFPAVHVFQAQLLHRDGMLFRPGMWARGLARLYGRGGYLSRLAPQYLEYFRRDFHPWRRDNSALIAQWKPTLMA